MELIRNSKIIDKKYKEFDPTTYQSEDKEELAIDNIMMLKAVSKKMEYQRVIGLNKTTVIF